MKYFTLLHSHPRLLIATLTGLCTWPFWPDYLPLVSRILLAWNVAVWVYLANLGWLMVRADGARIRAVAERQDENAFAVLGVVSLATVMSLAAILLELSSTKQSHGAARWLHLGITFSTLSGGWLLLPMAFGIHYAHLFYQAEPGKLPLLYPDKPEAPDYLDFLYFSFTIAVASQTADVAIGTQRARRIVLLQSILSFVFNTSILALSINIASSLVS